MDSGNSGSLQSSSGGDEEFDSRAADSLSHLPPQPPPFDPISNFLALQNSNSSLCRNAFWPRSNPSITNLRSDNVIVNQQLTSFPEVSGGVTAAAAYDRVESRNKNPKKRSRASRRAPTTVLTTDTNNFRAMVQEFTGIPAPPFTSCSSPFQRSRFDLFRRPIPLKVQSPPPSSSSTSNAASSINHQNQTPNSNFFLQTHYKFPFSTSKTQNSFEIPTNAHESNMFSSALCSLPQLIPSDYRVDNNNININNNNNGLIMNWRNTNALVSADDRLQAQTSPVDANSYTMHGTNPRFSVNLVQPPPPPASTSNYHGGKGEENAGSRN